MTKGEINYKNGKIYKIEPICEHDEGEIYIGSTTKQYLSQRMTAHRNGYKRFKEGKFQVLVATDVASRGLDIPNVDLVIQIEPPKDTETYIHRSGRTARAGKSGTCITFYMKKTLELVQKIEDQAGIKLKRIGIPQAEDIIKASSRGILKNLKDVNEDVLYLFEDLSKILIDQHDGNAEKAL